MGCHLSSLNRLPSRQCQTADSPLLGIVCSRLFSNLWLLFYWKCPHWGFSAILGLFKGFSTVDFSAIFGFFLEIGCSTLFNNLRPFLGIAYSRHFSNLRSTYCRGTVYSRLFSVQQSYTYTVFLRFSMVGFSGSLDHCFKNCLKYTFHHSLPFFRDFFTTVVFFSSLRT